MTTRILAFSRLQSFFCCGVLLVTVGCQGDVRTTAIKADPAAAGKVALDNYDSNSDGQINASEVANSPALQSAMSRVDTNRDGQISADEVAARIQKYDELSEFIAGEVRVTRNGKGVVGANVTMTPEVFMGEGFPTYRGTTFDGGSAPMQTDPPTPGIAVGFYKVTIETPDGAQSTKGVEIADDTPSAGRVEFEI